MAYRLLPADGKINRFGNEMRSIILTFAAERHCVIMSLKLNLLYSERD
jgi:hypothetical protein